MLPFIEEAPVKVDFDVSLARKSPPSLTRVVLPFVNESQAKAQAARAAAVRASNASVALEGFKVSAEVAELDRRYISGEITLDEKLVLIRKIYANG